MTTALYRRYRPQDFSEVIGQEHVTEPLMQALRTGRIGHAYLFSGPRGCGKTTSARILARCLNCEQGPTPTPCGQCESCRALATGGPGSVDVIEIDAASHGGVDDARDLREKAAYGPAQSRYKVYIIDEAHMVTSQGFNALLKIVEEPPEHVKFIFATTEPDKVIGTIRSRTHHYPFRLVPPARLHDYLEELCAREGVAVEPGVLSFVVRAGGGSVRDSLSVLDQLIAGSDEAGLTYAGAAALLGFTESELLDAAVDALAAGDGAGMFRQVDRVIETGQDPRRFVEDLLERFRDLIVLAALGAAGDTDVTEAAVLRGVPEDQMVRMRQQAGAFGPGQLSYLADVINAGLTEMTGATSPRLHLELLCARLLLPTGAGEHGYAARLDRLERRLEVGGGMAAPVPESSPRGTASPATDAPPTPPSDAGAVGRPPAGWRTEGRDTSRAAAEAQPGAAPSRPGEARPNAGGPASEPPRQGDDAAPQRPDAGRPGHDTPRAQHAAGAATPPPTARSGVPGRPEADSPSDAGPQERPDRRGTAAHPVADPARGGGVEARPGSTDRPGRPQVGAGSAPAGARVGRGTDTPSHGPDGGPAAPTAPVEQADMPQAGGPGIPATPRGGVDTEMIRRSWPDVLQRIYGIRRVTWTFLSEHAQVLDYDGQRLLIGLSTKGLATTFRNGPHGEVVRQALSEALGIDTRVEGIPADDAAAALRHGVAAPPASAPRPGTATSRPAAEHPARPRGADAGPAGAETRAPAPARAGGRVVPPMDDDRPPPSDDDIPPDEESLPPDPGRGNSWRSRGGSPADAGASGPVGVRGPATRGGDHGAGGVAPARAGGDPQDAAPGRAATPTGGSPDHGRGESHPTHPGAAQAREALRIARERGAVRIGDTGAPAPATNHDDDVSVDDEDIVDSGAVGLPVIADVLGGVVIREEET